MIQWEQKYELGIEAIDNQHRRLIEITSRLSDLLGDAAEGEDIFDSMLLIIEELRAYTVCHFQMEEKLFILMGYTNSGAHIAEHSKLIDEIENLDLKSVDEDQLVYGKKILRFLISWVYKHILGSDFLYKDLFIANLSLVEAVSKEFNC